jgi:hypothetical protein
MTKFRFILFIAITLFFTLLNADKFFFWDSISQISVPANWYYDNNFRYFFVPDEYATGHPTFVGMYIALLWKLFGKSLLVSHLAMFPFIFGILLQLDSFLKNSDKGNTIPLLILLFVICDATLVSQMSMVTFDIIQIFFFLWCINSIVYNKRFAIAIAFAGLSLTSLRGALCSFGIILFSLSYEYRNAKKIKFSSLILFLPGLIALMSFLLSFYIEKNWIIHNTVSNRWQQSREFASLSEVIRNIGLFGWRLIDYGRIGIWIVLFFIIYKVFINNKLKDSFFNNTFFIALCQFLVFFPIVIIYRNFIGQRYLLPIIIPLAICTGYWILKYSKIPGILFTIVFVILISGYFWVYPKKIAQGWDATPAHWPFYEIRVSMLDYLKQKSIPVSEVGSFFPNLASRRFTDLSADSSAFKEADLLNDKYILFSNVFNVADKKIDELYNTKKWIVKQKIKKRGVYMVLFQKEVF